MQMMFVIYQVLSFYSKETAADMFTCYTPWNLTEDGMGVTDCVWMIPNIGIDY